MHVHLYVSMSMWVLSSVHVYLCVCMYITYVHMHIYKKIKHAEFQMTISELKYLEVYKCHRQLLEHVKMPFSINLLWRANRRNQGSRHYILWTPWSFRLHQKGRRKSMLLSTKKHCFKMQESGMGRHDVICGLKGTFPLASFLTWSNTSI